MSVRIGEIAGIDDVQKVATTLGLGENIPRGPAIFIGSFETNLKDLTAAYSVFPNAGVRKQAYIIERIDDRGSQTDLSRGACHDSRARSRLGLDDLGIDGAGDDLRNGGQREVARLQAPGGRKNRNDERLQRRLVRRLYQRVDLRRVGRVRSAGHHRFARIRRGARPAGLDASR